MIAAIFPEKDYMPRAKFCCKIRKKELLNLRGGHLSENDGINLSFLWFYLLSLYEFCPSIAYCVLGNELYAVLYKVRLAVVRFRHPSRMVCPALVVELCDRSIRSWLVDGPKREMILFRLS